MLKVLNSAKKVMDIFFGRSFPGDIYIYKGLADTPKAMFAKSPSGAYIINITATDRFWSQYIYQFSHEYCHVRTNHAMSNYRTQWFEEAICELASIYTLIEVSRTWRVKPPYPNWRDFAGNFSTYAEKLISDFRNNLPENVGFFDWFEENLPFLEADPYLRDKNAIVAIELLPIFQEHPSAWNSMTYWNIRSNGGGTVIHSCLKEWLSILPSKNIVGAVAIAEVFNSR